MLIFYFFLFVIFYFFLFSSFHTLFVLLMVEVFVLLNVFLISFYMFSWLIVLMFLLIAVCMGAYGVCLMVSISRAKGFSYLFSF